FQPFNIVGIFKCYRSHAGNGRNQFEMALVKAVSRITRAQINDALQLVVRCYRNCQKRSNLICEEALYFIERCAAENIVAEDCHAITTNLTKNCLAHLDGAVSTLRAIPSKYRREVIKVGPSLV